MSMLQQHQITEQRSAAKGHKEKSWVMQDSRRRLPVVSNSATATNMSRYEDHQLPWGAPITDFPEQRLRGQTAMLVWELFTLIWILYIAFEVPYRAGFAIEDRPVCDEKWQQGIDIFSDMVFLVDAFLQSHSAYWLNDPLNGKWFLIDRPVEIRYIYFTELRPWERSLLWDLLAAFPFLQIGCVVRRGELNLPPVSDAREMSESPPHNFVMILAMLRILKGLRFWKIPESIDKITEQSSHWASIISLVRLCFFLFFAAHYLACAWFYIGLSRSSIEGGWLAADGSILPRGHTHATYFNEWIAAIYWGIATMTTIGYGDISGHTNGERIFAMFAMIMGSAYFAWLAGTVTGILRSSSAAKERFQGFLEEVQNYLNVNRFSEEIKQRVLIFYGLKYPTKNRFQEDEIMQSLPQGLVKKMRSECYVKILEVVPIFAEMTEHMKMDIANHFQTQLCSAGEELCTEGEEAEHLYIIMHGQVLLSHRDEPIHVSQPGEMFGELALFGLTADGQRMRSALALTECELLKLPYRSLKILIVTSNEFKVTFRKMVCRWLKMCSEELENPDSPIYDPDKLVYIAMEWQQGFISDRIRKPGKVPPPIFKDDFDEMKSEEVKHLIWIKMLGIKGMPVFGDGAGAVVLRTEIDWFPKGGDLTHCRRFCRDREYNQGQDLVWRQWLVLLKFHTRLKQKVTYPNLTIKIIFAGVFDGADEEQLHTTNEDRGRDKLLSKSRSFNGDKPLTSTSGRKRASVPAPHKETILAEFTVSSQELFSQSSFSKYNNITLRSTWNTGGQSGPIELNIACKVARQLPPGSAIKSTLRPILSKHYLKHGHAKSHKESLLRWLREVRGGVKNFLSRGDNGKGGAAAASVELQLEKNSEEAIARLRDMRAQIQRESNELDRKFDEKMESLHKALLRNMAGFEARVMSKIEHVHAALDKRIEAAALDSKNREELSLKQMGLNFPKMIGTGTFNFQTPEGTLRQNAAPPPLQPISLYPAQQATGSLPAEARRNPDVMQYPSAREPTPQNTLPAWRPPAAIMPRTESPLIYFEDPGRDPREVQSGRTISNVEPPARTGLSSREGLIPGTPPSDYLGAQLSAQLGFS